MRRVLFATLLFATPAFAQAKPSFTRDVVPILKTRCATCHLTGKEAGNIALYPAAAYASLVGAKSPVSGFLRVVPGKPDDSYVIMKLEGTHLAKGGKGARMPFGAGPLPAAQLALIRSWIKAGAKKD